jgi:hypothetical protein
MTQPSLPPRPSIATLLRSPGRSPNPVDTPVVADTSVVELTTSIAPAMDQPPLQVQNETDEVAAGPVESFDTSAPDETAPVALAVTSDATRKAQPSFARASETSAVTGRQWAVLAAFTITLIVQILLADRARLASQAGTRPLVETLCAALRCSLPPWHEPSAFTMLSRDVRPVPHQAGALQVQASFRNDARWAQSWPVLHLSLADADGRMIGERRLSAAEYRGANHDPSQRLGPGQSAQIAFRLREPAAATVAYSFDFQ